MRSTAYEGLMSVLSTCNNVAVVQSQYARQLLSSRPRSTCAATGQPAAGIELCSSARGEEQGSAREDKGDA